jgi:hypothetical protein
MTCIRPEQSRHGGRWGQATVTSRAEASDMFWQKDGEVDAGCSVTKRFVLLASRRNMSVPFPLDPTAGLRLAWSG